MYSLKQEIRAKDTNERMALFCRLAFKPRSEAKTNKTRTRQEQIHSNNLHPDFRPCPQGYGSRRDTELLANYDCTLQISRVKQWCQTHGFHTATCCNELQHCPRGSHIEIMSLFGSSLPEDTDAAATALEDSKAGGPSGAEVYSPPMKSSESTKGESGGDLPPDRTALGVS